jgi:hypothetical protein
MKRAIGTPCVVKERTKFSDRGSYVGVIVGFGDDKTVYVMNDNGVHTTVKHCVITDRVAIGKYYDEIKTEMIRLQKVIRATIVSMFSSENLMVRFCRNWVDYINPSFESRLMDIPTLSEKRLASLKKITEVNDVKRKRLSKYESQLTYLEDLADDIMRTFR